MSGKTTHGKKKKGVGLMELLGSHEKDEKPGIVKQVTGALASGLAHLLSNISPASFKSATIREKGAQVIKTPLGASMVATYETEVIIEADAEVIQAIEEAKELTERAGIEADKEVRMALHEPEEDDEV